MAGGGGRTATLERFAQRSPASREVPPDNANPAAGRAGSHTDMVDAPAAPQRRRDLPRDAGRRDGRKTQVGERVDARRAHRDRATRPAVGVAEAAPAGCPGSGSRRCCRVRPVRPRPSRRRRCGPGWLPGRRLGCRLERPVGLSDPAVPQLRDAFAGSLHSDRPAVREQPRLDRGKGKQQQPRRGKGQLEGSYAVVTGASAYRLGHGPPAPPEHAVPIGLSAQSWRFLLLSDTI